MSALERRAFLLSELDDLSRLGRRVPAGLRSLALRSPSAAEDYINFLRFVDPEESVQLIDIGANCGDWCGAFLSYFPKTSVFAIEPAAATFRQLQARFAGDARVHALQAGASETAGSAVLHIGKDSTLNSLERYAEQFAADRDNVIKGGEDVSLVRVDDVVKMDESAARRVLKIDVQGHELSALKGAVETLQRIDVALCELSFVTEYVGVAPSFPAVTALLAEAGLFPVIFQEYGTTLSNHRLECDVIYVRDTLFPQLYLKT